MIHIKSKRDNLIVKSTTLVMLTTTILIMMVVVATASTEIIGINRTADAFVIPGLGGRTDSKAPVVMSGDNIYVAWWTNNTENGNEEVMFRASNDGGATFGDKMNLSNTPDADSWRVEIAAEGADVIVSWWETNQTSDTPAARLSTDGGQTFGPMLRLGTNGTISSETTTESTTDDTTTATTSTTNEEEEAATTSVSIVRGSSELTDDAYQPNPIEVSIDDTITWTNDDIAQHTVTSGESGEPDGKFDSGLMSTGATFEHTFTEAGEYPYFCTLHPNMVGTVIVS